MLSELGQFLFSLGVTCGLMAIVWIVTRFQIPESLEVDFPHPRKEAAIAVGYVIGLFLLIAVAFFFLQPSARNSASGPRQFDLGEALRQWVVYAVISLVPISVLIRVRGQRFETVGVTRKNLRGSVAVGILMSIVFVLVYLAATPEWSLNRLLSANALFGFIYFLAVGVGEELMFRGFLQIRCTLWLGEIRGLILASVIMAFVHLPQRIFVVGLSPLPALVSAASLLPFSFLMGLMMLRTKNILGSSILHTVVNWVSVL